MGACVSNAAKTSLLFFAQKVWTWKSTITQAAAMAVDATGCGAVIMTTSSPWIRNVYVTMRAVTWRVACAAVCFFESLALAHAAAFCAQAAVQYFRTPRSASPTLLKSQSVIFMQFFSCLPYCSLDEDEIVEYVVSCQKDCGGFGPSPRHDPSILYTLSGIQVWIVLIRSVGRFTALFTHRVLFRYF